MPGCYDNKNHTNEGKVKQKESHVARDGDNGRFCTKKQNVSHQYVCLFDLILHVPSTIIQLNRDGSSWVEPVLS